MTKKSKAQKNAASFRKIPVLPIEAWKVMPAERRMNGHHEKMAVLINGILFIPGEVYASED